MPQLTATTTAARLTSGSWQSVTVQNLSSTIPVHIARRSPVTASGATGGLRIEPLGVVTLTAPSQEKSGPWVITASSTAVVAWEHCELKLVTSDSAVLTGAAASAAAAAASATELAGATAFGLSILHAANKAAVNALLA